MKAISRTSNAARSDKSVRSHTIKRIKWNASATAGASLIAAIAAVALFGSLFAPNDPLSVNMPDRLLGPSWQYPLGTDHLGRCLFSRLVAGAQKTLSITGLVILLAMLIGMPLGIVSGYFKGKLDALLMRVVDGASVLPDFLLVIAISGFLGPSLINMIAAIVLLNWIGYARLVRSIVLSEREKEYVAAAIVAGCSTMAVIRRHLLPAVLPHAAVYASLDIGKTILVIASLSFLGLGAQPPSPEWGAMLNDGRSFFQLKPELMLYPGCAIMLAVIGFQLLGEGLGEALDARRTK